MTRHILWQGFLFLFPVQQTTSGIGYLQVGNQYAECEKQQQQPLLRL